MSRQLATLLVACEPAGGWFEWRFDLQGEATRFCPRTVDEFTQQHSHGPAVSFRVVGRSLIEGKLLYGNIVTGRFAADGSVTWSKPSSSLIHLEPGEKYDLVLEVDWGDPAPAAGCRTCK